MGRPTSRSTRRSTRSSRAGRSVRARGGGEPLSSLDLPRVGISSCLLGEPVRYDGGHKHERVLTDLLGLLVEWVPVCPEVEAGLGVPREPIHLVRVGRDVRLRGVESGTDHTSAMQQLSLQRLASLAALGLSGYVLKAGSPSCGLGGVDVHADRGGALLAGGRGLFAAALTERFPDLPVEEEGRLRDTHLRERFVERILEYRDVHWINAPGA